VLRHLVLLRFTDAATPERVAAIAAGLDALPGQIPELRSYEHGPDATAADGNWDYEVTATFDDEAGWQAYTHHPAHRAVVVEHIAPILAERAAVQFETR
jgi:hypothetical protein